jgi:HEPN domain-containing protein
MVQEYPKEYAKDFLDKSIKFLEIAKQTLEKYPDESAFNATQAIINANDAFTISVIQKRASKDHREAILLHKEAVKKVGDSSKLSIVQMGLESRDATGYDVKKRFGKEEAELLVKRAERFIYWVRDKIKV